MIDTDKFPPTLREAVAAVLAEWDCGEYLGDEFHGDVRLMDDLRAAHEAPGAYGSPAGPFCPRCQKVQDDFHACQKAIATRRWGAAKTIQKTRSPTSASSSTKPVLPLPHSEGGGGI